MAMTSLILCATYAAASLPSIVTFVLFIEMSPSNFAYEFVKLGCCGPSPSTQPSSGKVPPVPTGRYLRHASAEDGQFVRNLSSWKQIEHDSIRKPRRPERL